MCVLQGYTLIPEFLTRLFFDTKKIDFKFIYIYLLSNNKQTNKMASNTETDEQYKKICDEEDCDRVLCENTSIMCYMNKEEGDKTLCQECYEDGDYKKDDENSDNEDEEEEYKTCYDCGACDKCKEWSTDDEAWNTDDEEEDEEEKKQRDILMSQSVWKIYFGAVLQDIREPNWREE